MSHGYTLLPALLMHINGAPGTIVDMGSGIFSTNGALHWLPPELLIDPYVIASPSRNPSSRRTRKGDESISKGRL